MVGMRTRRSSAGSLAHALQPFDAGHAEQLGVGHDVGLGHRHEILGAEIVADLDLMLDRPLPPRARTRRPASPFFVGQPHPNVSYLARSAMSDALNSTASHQSVTGR